MFSKATVFYNQCRRSVSRLIKYALARRYRLQTRMAEGLRQYRPQAIIAIAACACIYVIAGFIANIFLLDKPNGSRDSLLRNRFSSPPAAENIVIIDIDERSLAMMAEKYGRWPWPRNVLAEAVDKINQAGAKGILFNVMMGDADKDHPDADAEMAFVAGMATNTAFPMVRLAPKNDALSLIPVSAIPDVRLDTKNPPTEGKNIAMLFPVFAEMQTRLGVINQQPDPDGIVRRYPVWWNEPGFALKSSVLQTLDAGKFSGPTHPDRITLNWRNKQGSYTRLSIADLFSADLHTQQAYDLVLRNAWIVLGASAPGVGQVKATPVSPVMDDNEILATAMDDLLHDTYLRMLPSWVILLLTLAAIVSITSLSLLNVKPGTINQFFFIVQTGLTSVTLVCVSYTPYFVDLSEPISLLLLIFSAIKLVSLMESKNFRGIPNFFRLDKPTFKGDVHIAGFSPQFVSEKEMGKLMKLLEKKFGIKNVLKIDNVFNDEHFLPELKNNYQCVIVFDALQRRDLLIESLGLITKERLNDWHIQTRHFDTETLVQSEAFTQRLMCWLVANVNALLESRYERQNERKYPAQG